MRLLPVDDSYDDDDDDDANDDDDDDDDDDNIWISPKVQFLRRTGHTSYFINDLF